MQKELEEVCLAVDGQTFKMKKNVLCEHSDYFRAMFSGNYLENEQKEIAIDVVDANSMKIIAHYMNLGFIDLFEYPLPTVGELAMAANFLQVTELIKQIEYTLELQVSNSNWIEIMCIAETASYKKLENYCAGFGLLSFRNMQPEHIPSIHKLFWYLSHSYLDAGNELDVFKFGFQWVNQSETGADALLIILGCLDMKQLTMNDLHEIKKLMKDDYISLASKVVDCLLELFKENIELSFSEINKSKKSLCEKFTERVVTEVLNLVKESRKRTLSYVSTVAMWSMKEGQVEHMPHFVYTFRVDAGFERYLEVGDKSLWGWRVVGWGPMRLIVIGGEYGRGSGNYSRDVRVYNTLTKEWTRHGVELPQRRHVGLAVLDDYLFIAGGVREFRVVTDNVLIYDLKQRTYRKIAKLPDPIQNPGVCIHQGKVYTAGQNCILRYEDRGDSDEWVPVVPANIRMSFMESYGGYIYCTQNYFSHLYRFKPGVDSELQVVANFTNPPACICNLGDRLLFFTRNMCGADEHVAVEEYTGKTANEKPKLVWSTSSTEVVLNDVGGSCSLVMSMPPVAQEVSEYHRKYLKMYIE